MVTTPVPGEGHASGPFFLRPAISLAVAVVTLILGTVLPVLSGPRVASAFVNVVWGSVYGLGFWMVSIVPERGTGAINFATTVFGMLLWPAIVLYATYKTANIMLRRNLPAITVCAVFFLLSLLWNVHIGNVKQTFVYYLPLYTAFMDR